MRVLVFVLSVFCVFRFSWVIFLVNFGEWRHSRDKWLLQAPNFCHSYTTRLPFLLSFCILRIRVPLSLFLSFSLSLSLCLNWWHLSFTFTWHILFSPASVSLLCRRALLLPFLSLFLSLSLSLSSWSFCFSICIFTHFKLRWSATITACVLPILDCTVYC